MTTASMPAVLLDASQRRPDAVALRHKRRGIWNELTWAGLRDEVAALALGLEARGVRAGDAVALLGENRPGWIVADLALQSLGAAVVTPPPGVPPSELRRVLEHHRVRLAICGDQEHVDAVIEAQPEGVSNLLAFDLTGMARYDAARIGAMDAVCAVGRDIAAGVPERFGRLVAQSEAVAADAGPDLVTAARIAAEWLGLGPRDRNLCVLPLAAVTTRVIDVYAPLCAGAQVQLPETPASVPDDLRECAPTVLCVVPRALELLHRSSHERSLRATWVKRAAYEWAMRRLERRLARRGAARTVDGARRSRGLAYALVGLPVARDLGIDALRRVVCLDGPVGAEVGRFFWSLGTPVLEAPDVMTWRGRACS